MCVFSNDIRIEFGVEKCDVLTTKKRKKVNGDGIALNETTTKYLEGSDSYKYLEVTQTDGTKQHKMKEKNPKKSTMVKSERE